MVQIIEEHRIVSAPMKPSAPPVEVRLDEEVEYPVEEAAANPDPCNGGCLSQHRSQDMRRLNRETTGEGGSAVPSRSRQPSGRDLRRGICARQANG